ncbi:hypothetical protein J4455_03110, partial [Candidatus Woesearchaeota archaeon]|nr:hypothetical protein [Candidatus Woesearchaeota archaeon]
MKKTRRKKIEEKGFHKPKFLCNHNFAFLILFLLILIITLQDPRFIGHEVFFIEESIEEFPNLILTESHVYSSSIILENFDHIKSIKLSGRVAKEGNVKVYYNDILVLDNSALVNNENKVTGLSILNESLEVNISENETVEVIEILEETQEE